MNKEAIIDIENTKDNDLISRQATIDGINRYFHDEYYQRTSIQDCRDCLIEDVIKALPPVNPQESESRQFAKWVAEEIFDDYWEWNEDAFAELACRKLAKLGIVRAKGDEWELIDPQESEEV